MRVRLVNLCRDESGNTLVLFALMLVGLMLAIGGAIDVGRWLYARDDTLAAVDAAVLAGAHTLQTSKDEAAAVETAQKFYNLNVASRLPVTNDTISFAVVDGGTAVVATGSAEISTVFLQFADISTLPLVPASAAQIAKAEFALGSNGVWSGSNSSDETDEPESLEISVMLDVTGSMAGDKLDDLKAAATDLVNIVLWEAQIENPTKIALVPFSEDIRLPTSTARDAARGTGLPSSKTLTSGSDRNQQSKTYYLSDCVVERTGTQAYTDAVPDPDQYVMAHYTSSTTGSGSSKTGKCTIPDGAEIVPLTADKSTLLSEIEGLSASGGTAGHLGTAWAWYTLSPYWSKLWSTDSAPQSLRHAEPDEDRHPDDRRRVQHRVRRQWRQGRLDRGRLGGQRHLHQAGACLVRCDEAERRYHHLRGGIRFVRRSERVLPDALRVRERSQKGPLLRRQGRNAAEERFPRHRHQPLHAALPLQVRPPCASARRAMLQR